MGSGGVHIPNLIDTIEYKPGWTLSIENTADETMHDEVGLALHIIVDCPGLALEKHVFLLPFVLYNENTWIAWVFDRIQDVETYISGEFFKVGGNRIFAPRLGEGEDPYRIWHLSCIS